MDLGRRAAGRDAVAGVFVDGKGCAWHGCACGN